MQGNNITIHLQQNDEEDDQGAEAPVGQTVDFLTESFQRIVQQIRSQRDQDGGDTQDPIPDTNAPINVMPNYH